MDRRLLVAGLAVVGLTLDARWLLKRRADVPAPVTVAPAVTTAPVELVAPPPTPAPSPSPRVVLRTFHDHADSPVEGVVVQGCTVDARYAELTGLADLAVQERINALLRPERVERGPDGNCDTNSSAESEDKVLLLGDTLLGIERVSSYDGGAHPSNSVDLLTFSLADGRRLGTRDVFRPRAAARIRALVVAADADEDVRAGIDAMWPVDALEPTFARLELGVDAKGIVLDLTNLYPHVMVAVAPHVLLPWKDVAPALAMGGPVADLARAEK